MAIRRMVKRIGQPRYELKDPLIALFVKIKYPLVFMADNNPIIL